jgi:hypothetical protein
MKTNPVRHRYRAEQKQTLSGTGIELNENNPSAAQVYS